MPVEVLREMQRRLPEVRLWNFYGQTEIAPLATVLEARGPAAQGRLGRPAGAQRRDARGRRRDARRGARARSARSCTARRSCCTGYFNDDERTAAAFEGGWFHSGDLATIDDEGYITVVDRKKDMIKTGGENVASREVEEAIYRLPRVSEVAVIGLPHPRWIEAVTAVVVRQGRARARRGRRDRALPRAAWPRFKVPKRVVFADALPKNPSGKLLKRELRRAHESLYAAA